MINVNLDLIIFKSLYNATNECTFTEKYLNDNYKKIVLNYELLNFWKLIQLLLWIL